MLFEQLSKVAIEYTYERGKPFTGSKFAEFVRHDIAVEAKKRVSYWPFDLTVKSSVGQGVWASVPWLAFFDPLITNSATRGFYVVCLVNSERNEVVLSMNQGTTAIYREYGQTQGKEILARRAKDIAARVPEFASKFSTDPIDLSSEAELPKGYEYGHSFGKTYKAGSVSEEAFDDDLFLMLSAYEQLVNRGGTTPSEEMQLEAQSDSIEETRKYVLSRRIERSPKVREAVLSKKAAVCEACGLEPALDYGFKGKKYETPLDVHHAVPLHGLSEGETRRYRIPDDFLVLCPSCHRMIHKLDLVSDLDSFKKHIRFRFARITDYPMK